MQMNRLACLLPMLLLAVPASGADEASPDAIRILAISPPEPVTRGVQVELTIDVEATLESGHEGVAMVGFNTESPEKFEMEDSHQLVAGAQQLTFEIKVVPVDWQERGEFAVLVNMGPQEKHTASWVPTASARETIEVEP